MRWAEIIIEAEPGARDAVGAALQDAGCTGFEVRDEATPPAVAGYLPVDDRLEGRLAQIGGRLRALPFHGVEGAGTELTLRTVQEEDWANAWKAFFKPIRVGRHLVVTPPWESPDLDPGDTPLVIDPGMAFGTGSHPTTQLCLAALEDHVRPGLSVADIGTGSGILAIAAAKLGASPVVANDIEPPATKIAAENAKTNGVTIQTRVPLPDGPFDVVVANILADVIIGLAPDLATRVRPGGILIASGIIDTREDDVRAALESVGFAPQETRRQAEWVALILRRT
ncbi:MAG: 50S ribosomal protein L11 methyltransferase [Armatimonadetes bacterium]|nr:50S ribosomal protein L11 methyltransferase [Armatimonadota bacterium]